MAIIHLWLSANLFQLGWNANYELYTLNPIPTIPIAHGIWDAHIPLSYDYTIVLSYSAIYNVVCTVGFTNVFQIYNFVIICELLAAFCVTLGKLHLISVFDILQWLPLNKSYLFITTTTSLSIIIVQNNIRFNFHTGILFGLFSIAWCGHLINVAIPISRGINLSCNLCLTCNGGLNWIWTHSLYLTDIAHHHLASGILFVWASHVYLSLFKAFGYRTRSVLYIGIHVSSSLISRPLNSLHLKLTQHSTTCGLITAAINQHIYSLTPSLYLSYDYIRTVALYVHHSWIAEFLMIATFAHKAIFLIRDYSNKGLDVIGRILAHKASIISHLSWICLWLGFHTLGVYIHNDTFHAFGEQEKQILIEPTNAQIIQQSSGKANYGISLTYQSVHKSFDSFILPLGPGDLCAHHAIALGLHITAVILLKGALDGRGSKLMADKIHQHYGYSCDGPGRGGTCDISAWDSFYLATFWMLNTGAWITFYFHWKHMALWQNTLFQFDESSTYLNAWFRDYLWFNCTPLIDGYTAFGANDLSIWASIFLGAHLCWSLGFMFLISWRGYWQELIDIILYMHLKTPILYNLWNGDIYTPVALSIVQGRFVGLVHFSAGFILTYPPFIIGATS